MKRATADSVLGKSVANTQPLIAVPAVKPGFVAESETDSKFDYHKAIKEARYFYTYDPIAGTVINRLCEIAVTPLRNRRKNRNSRNPVSDEIMAYYNAVAANIKPFLRQIALEYVLHGMALPEFTTVRKMGNRATDLLGRTRYYFPDKLWCRNLDNIRINKLPTGADRIISLVVPSDEIDLIKKKGGKDPAKKALYDYLLAKYPEYVAAVERGVKQFPLDNLYPLYRKMTSYNTYPIPYLMNALDPMRHKKRLKDMDMSIAARIIEAVRQIKVGNDEYPADDDDLKAEQASFIAYGNSGEKVFNYFTNHTVDITWSYPPFEQLLNEAKYLEPNREVFMALGFPRIWVNGETEKSNASDNQLASQGPLSSIEDIRDSIILWVKWFYEKLAELNGFDKIPEPYFSPIVMSDVATLIQYGVDYFNAGAVSKETLAALYGVEWEQENAQLEAEKVITPETAPITMQEQEPINITPTLQSEQEPE